MYRVIGRHIAMIVEILINIKGFYGGNYIHIIFCIV